MPADYCYQKDWDTLMDSYRKCLAIAKRYGLRMSVECFPYSMISTPHAMLQLLKDVDDPDFGIQLDTNHLIMQHIDPEWTIYMLGGKRISMFTAKTAMPSPETTSPPAAASPTIPL